MSLRDMSQLVGKTMKIGDAKVVVKTAVNVTNFVTVLINGTYEVAYNDVDTMLAEGAESVPAVAQAAPKATPAQPPKAPVAAKKAETAAE